MTKELTFRFFATYRMDSPQDRVELLKVYVFCLQLKRKRFTCARKSELILEMSYFYHFESKL